MKDDKYFVSRICYIIEETVGYLISILVTGAYLAKLCQSLSFSDGMVAVLSSFTSLGCLFQLAAIFFTGRGSYKRKVTILYTINQLMFTILYVLPIFEFNIHIKTIVFIFLLLSGHFLINAAAASRTVWFMALVPDKKRGSFTSLKEGISLVCGIAFQFLMGLVADYYDSMQNDRAYFIVCGTTIFVMMIIHTMSLILANEKEPETKEKLSVFKCICDVIEDKKIRPVIFGGLLWAMCTSVSIPFLGTYQIKELSFSMTFIALLSVLYALARIIASVYLGKYADKHSFAKMLVICYAMVAICFFIGMFTVPDNGHLFYLLHHILYAIAMGGINSADINLIYDVAMPEKRAYVLGIKTAFCGVAGFVTTVIATPVIDFVQSRNNTLFGMKIYAQQLLMMISFVLAVFLVFYAGFKLTKITKWNKEM